MLKKIKMDQTFISDPFFVFRKLREEHMDNYFEMIVPICLATAVAKVLDDGSIGSIPKFV